MDTKSFDVVIVGAGPAGCAAAYMLSGKGLKIALLEKTQFPRDKTCGDALSADISRQLHLMSNELGKKFEMLAEKVVSTGVRFFSPNYECLDIAFQAPREHFGGGFVARRVDFDQYLFDEVKALPDVEVFENFPLLSTEISIEKINLKTPEAVFQADIALGADGAHSVLNKRLPKTHSLKDQNSAGLRQYYENVKGCHEENFIELHFYKDILPGYFWIFPLPGNKVNVGIGILTGVIRKKKINLKKEFEKIIATHPVIKERFAEAIPLEDVKGYGLPLGSVKRPISGDRFLLLGDAAALIEPFTGEGIANAIRSGRIAAAHVQQSILKNRFDEKFNAAYDREIHRKMLHEFRFGRTMQKLFRYPGLINYIVKKGNTNKSVQLLLSATLNNVNMKKIVFNPSFYLRLFFS